MANAIPTHAYQPDGLSDRRGGIEGCQHCPLPRVHPVHTLPATPADAAQLDARKLGEADPASERKPA